MLGQLKKKKRRLSRQAKKIKQVWQWIYFFQVNNATLIKTIKSLVDSSLPETNVLLEELDRAQNRITMKVIRKTK